jgi:hypothetical protein
MTPEEISAIDALVDNLKEFTSTCFAIKASIDELYRLAAEDAALSTALSNTNGAMS